MDPEEDRIFMALKKQCEKELALIKSEMVCCPLPFPLQDHCLLVVMSNLDSYPRELLALLPLKLRQRLLSILPAFDLCCLEHTPVAAGVDVSALWKSRPALHPLMGSHLGGLYTNPSSNPLFQLNICSTHSTYVKRTSLLEEAFGDIDQSELSLGLRVASDIFANSTAEDNVAISKLLSIGSSLMFSNLLCGSLHHHSCQTSLCGQRVWKIQATALAIQKHTTLENLLHTTLEKIQLIPRNHQLILDEHGVPLKLLSSLARECGLQPPSAFVDIDFIYDLMLPERLKALDGGSKLASDKCSWISTVNRMLSKVVILRLQSRAYSHISVMTGLIEAAMDYSQLKYLFCSVSNLYLDIIQPLQMLFSVPSFHQLALEVDALSPLSLCKLLYGFMTAHCSHMQKLIIDVRSDLDLPTSLALEPNQIAALYKGDCSMPSSLPEYKVFQLFTRREECTSALYLLLQLPTIRLKEINCSEYLHPCTIHPDMQTTKIVIDMDQKHLTESPTIQADLISLLGMPSLKKIVISGCWGNHSEVKFALVQGLRNRSRSLPLKKIALELTRIDSYEIIDLQMLFEAIFSLPNLENLKLVLGEGFADIIQQPGHEVAVHECWLRIAGGVQLKSICLQTHDTKLELVSSITQKLSFSLKVTKPYRGTFSSDEDDDYCNDVDSYYDSDSDPYGNDHYDCYY